MNIKIILTQMSKRKMEDIIDLKVKMFLKKSDFE